ncbi:HET-domain-containing protein [Lojkania enalia]|uniref:HET-domain-containing protein n=1 Tax=Lojkania enalia TaxID=147567 RepID=A0A9P4K8T8_9PLEO|nr:HET-domain-containing protein [Didymosphaeria enalia]
MDGEIHLCSSCTVLGARLATEPEFSYLVAETFHGLEQSSASGCHLCRLIRQRLIYHGDENIEALRNATSGIFLEATLEHILVESPLPRNGRAVLWPRYELGDEDENGNDNDAASLLTEAVDLGQHGINSLQSEQGLNTLASIARNWILHCLASHETCQLPFSAVSLTSPSSLGKRMKPFLPTRVIDLGTRSEPLTPRLLVSGAEQCRADYFALSYSWGVGTHSAKTTLANLAERQQRIDMSTLPKTIQEAIIFTKRVGIVRYLWVDAICIIQIDEKDPIEGERTHKLDWAIESQNFGEYYHNALCTLAATGSSCSTQGLFLNRPGLDYSVQVCKFLRYNPSGNRLVMKIEPEDPTWSKTTSHAPLLRRGWAMQERAMSMRILHFARDIVFWECNEIKASESSPRALPEESTLTLGEGLMKLSSLIQCIENNNHMTEWLEFATSYSRCQFSYFSDKLSALSGLAHRMQSLTDLKYSAGVWEGNVHDGIVWYSQWMRPIPPYNKIHKAYIAPSWSWASIPVASTPRFILPFKFKGSDFGTDFGWVSPLKIIDLQTEVIGKDSTGPVRNGRLRANGLLTHIDLQDYNQVTPSSKKPLNAIDLSPKGLHQPSDDLFLYLDIFHEELSANTSMVPCLLVAEEHDPESGNRRIKSAAIALRPTGRTHNGVDEYIRIGLIVIPRAFFESSNETVVDIV